MTLTTVYALCDHNPSRESTFLPPYQLLGDVWKRLFRRLANACLPDSPRRLDNVPLWVGTWARCVWEKRSGCCSSQECVTLWPSSYQSLTWSFLSRNHVRLFSPEIFWWCELDHVVCDKSPSLSLGIWKTDETADSWLLTLYANDEL